jgi:hypothetical protein
VKAHRALALALLLLGVSLWAVGPAEAQCSLCKAVLIQSPEGRQMSASFNTAILVLLFAPYLVLGSLALVLFRVPIAREVARRARLLLLPR